MPSKVTMVSFSSLKSINEISRKTWSSRFVPIKFKLKTKQVYFSSSNAPQANIPSRLSIKFHRNSERLMILNALLQNLNYLTMHFVITEINIDVNHSLVSPQSWWLRYFKIKLCLFNGTFDWTEKVSTWHWNRLNSK